MNDLIEKFGIGLYDPRLSGDVHTRLVSEGYNSGYPILRGSSIHHDPNKKVLGLNGQPIGCVTEYRTVSLAQVTVDWELLDTRGKALYLKIETP